MPRDLYLRPVIETDAGALAFWRAETEDWQAGRYPGGPEELAGIGGGAARFFLCEAILRSYPGRGIESHVLRRDELAARFPEEAKQAVALHERLTMPRVPLCGLPPDCTQVMGILNATPDSFSDGGVHENALGDRVRAMVGEGASIVDIGGESTRPNAPFVEIEDEWRRVAPALEAASETAAVVSIDTRKAEIARRAFALGARIFNDVTALQFDPGSIVVARDYAEAGGAICLMHMLGDPATMQRDPRYDHVLLDIYDHLEARIVACEDAGIPRSAIIADPGIGFGKTLEHNLDLIRGLSLFHGLGCPVLLGASRKRFIGTLGVEDIAARRVPGSIVVACHGAAQGAQIVRVHDVRETVQALAVQGALLERLTGV